MAARRRGGMSDAARQRIRQTVNEGQYSGTLPMERERARKAAGEAPEFPTTTLTDISPWVYPGKNHPPDESTRVQAFKFVANTSIEDMDDSPYARAMFGGSRYGTIFVRFIKYGTPWRYSNVPQTVYEQFFASPSKGKFINSTLNNYPYGRVTGDEYSAYFDDM